MCDCIWILQVLCAVQSKAGDQDLFKGEIIELITCVVDLISKIVTSSRTTDVAKQATSLNLKMTQHSFILFCVISQSLR